jgi:hypothetical protein
MCRTECGSPGKSWDASRSEIAYYVLAKQGFVEKGQSGSLDQTVAAVRRRAKCLQAGGLLEDASRMRQLAARLYEYGPKIRKNDPNSARIVEELYYAHAQLDPCFEVH